jgi:hypothetical protein
MNKCKQCETEFTASVTIDGEIVVLEDREYCLACHPYAVAPTCDCIDSVDSRGRFRKTCDICCM